MTRNEFITIFKDIIQSDADITLETQLADIEDWDSMAIMALIAYFDVNRGVTATFDQLRHAQTVGDIADLASGGK